MNALLDEFRRQPRPIQAFLVNSNGHYLIATFSQLESASLVRTPRQAPAGSVAEWRPTHRRGSG